MHNTIEAECRELAEAIGQCVFPNLHMLNAGFPFKEVLKKPEPEDAVKGARDAIANHVMALVNLYKCTIDDVGEPSSGSLSAKSSSSEYADSEAVDSDAS